VEEKEKEKEQEEQGEEEQDKEEQESRSRKSTKKREKKRRRRSRRRRKMMMRRRRRRRRKRRRRRRRNCRVERASQQAAVQQFEVFANIEALVTSMRAERGFTTSVVILEGKDAGANEILLRQKRNTDGILLNIPVWPDGLAINGVQLTTNDDLMDMLTSFRGQASTLSVDYHDVLHFYTDLIHLLIYWLMVQLANYYKINF